MQMIVDIWNWLQSLNWAVITAITSFVFSLVAMITSYASYRHAHKISNDDFKLKYEDIFLGTDISLRKLETLFSEAKRSKHSILAARGTYHSGYREKWDKDLEKKEKEYNDLKSDFVKKPNPNLKDLISLKNLQTRIFEIVAFCEASMEDDKTSSQRLEDQKNAFFGKR